MATRFSLSRTETNMAVQKNAFGPLRSSITLAVWEAGCWFLATQTKASGNEFHLGVLVKLCGKLRATRSDRAAASNLRSRQGYAMSDDRPKRDNMSLEEATVSNMWEIAAIVEVLERKGLCTSPHYS